MKSSLINFLKIRRHNAMPGVSAKKHQRNVSETAMNKEMDIKPQLHSQFSKQFYLPGKQVPQPSLTPYGTSSWPVLKASFITDKSAILSIS